MPDRLGPEWVTPELDAQLLAALSRWRPCDDEEGHVALADYDDCDEIELPA
jgi:hypothetical protein